MTHTLFDDFVSQLGRPESETLEYKRTVPPAGSIAKVIAAFANTTGGLLVVGARETSAGVDFVGIPENAPAAAAVNASLLRLAPKPDVRQSDHMHEGKRVYVVSVAKARTMITAENGTIYLRRGPQIYVATPKESIKVISVASRPVCVDELLAETQARPTSITESLAAMFRQYGGLAKLIEESISILCPDGENSLPPSTHGRALVRLVFSSLSDSFERYMSDLLIEIHFAQPKTLSSKMPLTAEEIVSCNEMIELIGMIANRRVEALGKGSTEGFAKHLKEIAKIELFTASESTKANEISLIRNLYTHANGVVDERFSRFVRSSLKVGDEHATTLAELCATFWFFLRVARRIDREAMRKYKLSGTII